MSASREKAPFGPFGYWYLAHLASRTLAQDLTRHYSSLCQLNYSGRVVLGAVQDKDEEFSQVGAISQPAGPYALQ